MPLELTQYIKNDMTQIGKVEWVYRFCFREAVQGKKSDATAPFLANLILRSGQPPSVALSSI